MIYGPFDSEKTGDFALGDAIVNILRTLNRVESLIRGIMMILCEGRSLLTSGYFSIRPVATSICSRVSLRNIFQRNHEASIVSKFTEHAM